MIYTHHGRINGGYFSITAYFYFTQCFATEVDCISEIDSFNYNATKIVFTFSLALIL